jgi:hypothetical protein
MPPINISFLLALTAMSLRLELAFQHPQKKGINYDKDKANRMCLLGVFSNYS